MMGNVTGGLSSRDQGSQRYVERRGDKSCLEIIEMFFDICQIKPYTSVVKFEDAYYYYHLKAW